MNTKKCEHCGWEYSINYPEKRCHFCGTIFRYRICSECGLYAAVIPSGSICKKCKSKRDRSCQTTEQLSAGQARYRAKITKTAETRFNEWTKKIAAVPELKTLTQDEWIAACSYFNKCAVCHKDEIDTRVFFITFSFGGRYAAWNVIPACEKCATALRRRQNPFITMDPKAVEEIVAYLQPILERTIHNES